MLTNYLHKNIQYLRKSKNIKQAEIQSSLGVVRNTWSNWENGISEPKIEIILKIAHFFDVSVGDLMTQDLSIVHLSDKSVKGKKSNNVPLKVHPTVHLSDENERKTPKSSGEISPFLVQRNLGTPHVIITDSEGNENIVHVPVKARAGYLTGYEDPHFIETLYSYRLPGLRHGTYRSFEVDGQSMKPTLLSRDWVVGEWVESLDNIRENRIHIIVTQNDGILIKRVLNRISERNKVYLKSDTITQKHEFPIIELDPSEIKEIWYARIRFSPDFSEPSDVFTRLNNMEIAIHDLQKQGGIKPV